MKKFMILLLSVVLCFAAVVAISGCAGVQGPKGATGATGATGAQGEKGDKGDKGDTGEKGDKGDKGDTGEKGTDGAGVVTNKIYRVNDEVTVVQNGYELFKIKVTFMGLDSSYTIRMTVTNINMPSIPCAKYIAVSFLRANGTTYSSGNASNQTVNSGQSGNFIVDTSYSNLNSIPPTKIFLGFPNADGQAYIPYAIYQP